MPHRSRANAKDPQKFGRNHKPGRNPKKTPEEQESHALAVKLGRSGLGKAVLRLLEGLDATKIEYVKQGLEFVPMGEVDDHKTRIAAARELCDRFGIPKTKVVAVDDPMAPWLEKVKRIAAEAAEAESAPSQVQ